MRHAPIALLVVGLLAPAGCGGPQPLPHLGVPPKSCSTNMPVAFAGSANMEPGGDCINCHDRIGGEAPSFFLAGTVMGALGDDTNCQGVAGVVVKLTGADGRVVQLSSNSSGNFYINAQATPLVFPFHAEVTRNGVTNQMLGARSAGETSCNRCHTPTGANGAPGRILAP